MTAYTVARYSIFIAPWPPLVPCSHTLYFPSYESFPFFPFPSLRSCFPSSLSNSSSCYVGYSMNRSVVFPLQFKREKPIHNFKKSPYHSISNSLVTHVNVRRCGTKVNLIVGAQTGGRKTIRSLVYYTRKREKRHTPKIIGYEMQIYIQRGRELDGEVEARILRKTLKGGKRNI